MTDIFDTIREYDRSCILVRGRIAELNARISGVQPLKPGESIRMLEERRYLLYCELAQMERSAADLIDYINCIYLMCEAAGQ